MEENTFDMAAYFESLPSTDEKTALRAALYEIETICQQHWQEPLAQELFPAVERALEALKALWCSSMRLGSLPLTAKARGFPAHEVPMIVQNIEIKERTGYSVGETGLLIGAPCCCVACDDGVQPGHFACEQPTPALLQAERDGLIVRYLMGVWCWYAA